MTRVIAITQFVFLAMGAFTLNVIVKASVYPDRTEGAPSAFSVYLAQHGIWLLLVPLLWVVYAMISASLEKSVFSTRVANAVGIFLAAVMLGAYSWAIFRP